MKPNDLTIQKKVDIAMFLFQEQFSPISKLVNNNNGFTSTHLLITKYYIILKFTLIKNLALKKNVICFKDENK